jgi:hypothetical protein
MLAPGTTESNINRCPGNVLRKTWHSGKIAGLAHPEYFSSGFIVFALD